MWHPNLQCWYSISALDYDFAAYTLNSRRGIAFVASTLIVFSNRHGYYCGALHSKSYWQGCKIAQTMAANSEEKLAGAFESAGSVSL